MGWWTSWKESWRQPGGEGEVLWLALPLIVSNSFHTLQITIDRIMLSWLSSDAVAASMPAALVFWTPLALLYNTSAYTSTFVAQYLGAGRPRRVGPAVNQALYFSLFTGLGFLAFLPLAGPIMTLTEHPSEVQALEVTYFRCLCFSVLPALVLASVSGFFSGRGDSKTVMILNGVGFAVNSVLNYLLIFGNLGFPELGMAGAGWGTVGGNVAAATVALALYFRRKYREEYATLSGWRFERELFSRLMYYGLPAGAQWMLDGLAFLMFVVLVGQIGVAELAATNIAVTLNLLAFLPPMGIGQAVAILVGQRLGQEQPDLAERTTWTGFRLAWLLMTAVALLFVLAPKALMGLFSMANPGDSQWSEIEVMVPNLLLFVAAYCLFDSMNAVFSFALRGAGDTRFVTVAALILSWVVMVGPSWLSVTRGWGLYWAWAFASAYVIVLALTMMLRFRVGKWKEMRVIEAAVH